MTYPVTDTHCRPCEVAWYGRRLPCWSCGEDGVPGGKHALIGKAKVGVQYEMVPAPAARRDVEVLPLLRPRLRFGRARA